MEHLVVLSLIGLPVALFGPYLTWGVVLADETRRLERQRLPAPTHHRDDYRPRPTGHPDHSPMLPEFDVGTSAPDLRPGHTETSRRRPGVGTGTPGRRTCVPVQVSGTCTRSLPASTELARLGIPNTRARGPCGSLPRSSRAEHSGRRGEATQRLPTPRTRVALPAWPQQTTASTEAWEMTEVPDTGDTPALEPADATDKRRMDGRQLLSTAKGIVIARRTVAKYRSELNILPSHLRKKY